MIAPRPRLVGTMLLLLGPAACSGGGSGGGSEGAPPAGDTGVATDSTDAHPSDDGGRDTGPVDGAPLDAIADVRADALPTDTPVDGAGDSADPLAALGACLGDGAPLLVSGQMPYVDVPVGAEHGAFLLDFATTFSSIDLAAFPAPPATSGCDPSRLGQTCTVPGFAFFSGPGPVTLVTEDYSWLKGTVRQAGIVGTDFLSEKVFTLSWTGGRAFAARGGSFCAETAMRAAGFAPLSAAGFFVNDLTTLRPMTDVDSSAPASWRVPNVPTVPVRIAGATAVAQLDTGFDDAVTRFSINVNDAYRAAIVAADAGALVRDPSLDLTLSTCVAGVSEPVEGYRLGPTSALELVDDAGAAARSYPGAVVYVKRTPAAAHGCGGIGTWTAPAAQVAASYFVDLGVVAFDPFASRVWVPRH